MPTCGYCRVIASGFTSARAGWWQRARVIFSRLIFYFMAERYLSLSDVKEKHFPSRSLRWIKDTFRALAGEDAALFPVMRDGSGWQISVKAIESYQQRHTIGLKVIQLRPQQRDNLKQAKA